MRAVLASGAAEARIHVGGNTDVNFGVGAGDVTVESDGTGCSGVAPPGSPFLGETPPGGGW